MEHESLRAAAVAAASNSYSPYSRFRVGAALRCADGTIVSGTNVENRSYGLTICAERSAIAAAISAGHREFTAIAVYSPDAPTPLPPCGACRQVISEFLGHDAIIHFSDADGHWERASVREIIPFDSLHHLRQQ